MTATNAVRNLTALFLLCSSNFGIGSASRPSRYQFLNDGHQCVVILVQGAPQGQAGTISKKQAVMGPSRDKYDLLREQLAYWKTTSAEEKKRREQAEADAVMAKEDAQEGAKLELHNYIQEYEKECANHYGKEAADLRQQLRALQGHSMGVLNDLNQERERAAEAMETLANEQAAHERNMADKTSEVLALMSRMRATRSHAPAVNQPPFPVSQPAMRPEFCSPATREQRSIERMIRTSNGRIPVIPLQPPSPATDFIREVLKGMNIVEVVQTGKGKKAKRYGTKMALAVKDQQANMSKEEDLSYKWGLRELWDLYTNTVHAVDFRHYVPVEADAVDRCNEGYEGPSENEFTLDFGQGFMTSLWNKTIIQKLRKIFLEKRAEGLGWNLANVTEEYVEGELYGQLQRSQQEWARWQPRFLPLLGRQENEAEIRARVERYQGHRQTRVNSRSNKSRKLAKRQKTVAKMIEIKSVNGAPDLEFWHLLKRVLNYLDVGGLVYRGRPVVSFWGTLFNPANTELIFLSEWLQNYVIPGAQAIIVLKSEFPQMTLWLERKEKIYQHENYIQWRLDGCPSPPIIEDIYPGIVFERHLKMTKHPTLKLVGMSRLVTDYGATLFRDALARYVVHFNNLDLSPLQVEQNSQDLSFAQDPYSAPGGPDSVVDSIHIQPRKTLKNGEDLPARFDTALVNGGNGQITGVAGYRVWSRITPPKYLTYVKSLSPFKDPEADHLMYKVNGSMKDGYCIIPVVNIRRSVHLLPKFGPVAPADRKSSNVLDKCFYFFVNSLTDRHIYATLF
ncbi:hypothetical protein B0H14DRAFT_3664790 [Mycena olivaceomarginata]|nr:hypothetical protein B0H14DRAFT_3664790 [Mycena olivaceomarginata]